MTRFIVMCLKITIDLICNLYYNIVNVLACDIKQKHFVVRLKQEESMKKKLISSISALVLC
ncbi:MAG: hypothetical protein IKA99_03310, partial [Clostridia bacterium]|nr:hypothetical protein [Clostridia bacterium]